MNTHSWFALLLLALLGPGAVQADEKEPTPDTRSLNPFEECAAPSDHAAQRLARVLKALDYKALNPGSQALAKLQQRMK